MGSNVSLFYVFVVRSTGPLREEKKGGYCTLWSYLIALPQRSEKFNFIKKNFFFVYFLFSLFVHRYLISYRL